MDIEKVIENIKFDEKGLVPTITQDINTKEVLMLAYMDKLALRKTFEEKIAYYYSRSRKKLWKKGETSGNIQKVKELSYDCDGDTILLKVEQIGVACHTGNYSCFFNKVIEGELKFNTIESTLEKLYAVIKNRKNNPKENSYTNYLFNEGLDKILKKIGEESSEVIISAKNTDKNEIIYEISDLIYHTLVLMIDKGVKLNDIKNELENRSEE